MLAADKAIGQPAHVGRPGGVVHHRQHEARGVDVAVDHQPPPVVVVFSTEHDFGALKGQPRANDLAGFSHFLLALRHIGNPFQNAEPVYDCTGRPLVRRNRDTAQHAALRLAVARKRFNGCQLAHIKIFARAPELALDTAFDKSGQAGFHRCAYLVRQGKGRVNGRCLMSSGQQVGGQGIAAARCLAVAWWKVIGQAVAVKIAGDLPDD